MNKHILDGITINCWDDFHDFFSAEFNFPSYYGRNMDAWNDCMSDLYTDRIIVLEIKNVEKLKINNREIYDALIECCAFINWRFTANGSEPIIALSFFQ